LLLGCGFHRVEVHYWCWRWRRRSRPDVKLGDDRFQVVFGLLPEICRTVLELVAVKRLSPRVHQRGQTLHSNLSAPHPLFSHLFLQHLKHALRLRGQVHYLSVVRGDAFRWERHDSGVRLSDWVGVLPQHLDQLV
ncbi:unnamed protein product, partial [Ectocarpus sp. 12 AP-2014]